MEQIAMVPPVPPEISKEIESVKRLVAKHFPVYDVRVDYDEVKFYVRADPVTLEENFEQLREEMGQNGYIPVIVYERGEHVVHVGKKPNAKYRSMYVNLTLLIVTFITMLLAGVLDWASYSDVPGKDVFAPETVLMGMLVFTLPLMAILGVHELAHYFAAKRRKVAASLPFFIPSFPPLGTFGAFISLRDPIPNRKALLEIGVAGPLAGLFLAIPIGVLGLILTNAEANPVPLNVGSGGVMGVAFPLLYQALEWFVPIEGDYLMHPTAFAAWVGFLVTALNLLPVGQLDGGHIARALLGPDAKWMSWATIAALIAVSFYYPGWILFAALVLFLGAKHPPPLNDISKLDMKRKGVGIAAFVVLVIAFVPVPMTPISADHSFMMVPTGETNVTVTPGESHMFSFTVDNIGNTLNEIDISKDSSPAYWTVAFKRAGNNDSSYADTVSLRLNSSETRGIDVLVTAAPNATVGQNESVVIKGAARNASFEAPLNFNFTVNYPRINFSVGSSVAIARGTEGNVTITVDNAGTSDANVSFGTEDNRPAFVDYLLYQSYPVLVTQLNLTVPPHSSVTFYVNIIVGTSATPGDKMVYVDVTYGELPVYGISVNFQVT